MKRQIGFAAAFLLLLYTGCGVSDLDDRDTAFYLQNRYDREFTLRSKEDVPDDPEGGNWELYEDADGVQFHVYHFLRHGIVGSYVVTDDYAVQWLYARPELYAGLEHSDYACERYNTLGNGEQREAGFSLAVSSYEEIRPAAELMFETVQQEGAVLPDRGRWDEEDDFFRMAIIPEITLTDASGRELESLPFRTEEIPDVTDEENFIRHAQQRYIDRVNDGSIRETLPRELLKREYSEHIPVWLGDEETAKLQILNSLEGKYYIEDRSPQDKPLQFPQLRTICESAGYSYKSTKNKVTITREGTTVIIARRGGEGHNRSIYTVYKNGARFQPEGRLDDYLTEESCPLSIADYQHLFGIEIAVDYDAQRAEIRS